jgi:hypothetical protein
MSIKDTMTNDQISTLIKCYVDQAVMKNGLPVDKLPYSKNLKFMRVAFLKEYPKFSINEKEIYHVLILLRKARKLPKLFRHNEMKKEKAA